MAGAHELRRGTASEWRDILASTQAIAMPELPCASVLRKATEGDAYARAALRGVVIAQRVGSPTTTSNGVLLDTTQTLLDIGRAYNDTDVRVGAACTRTLCVTCASVHMNPADWRLLAVGMHALVSVRLINVDSVDAPALFGIAVLPCLRELCVRDVTFVDPVAASACIAQRACALSILCVRNCRFDGDAWCRVAASVELSTSLARAAFADAVLVDMQLPRTLLCRAIVHSPSLYDVDVTQATVEGSRVLMALCLLWRRCTASGLVYVTADGVDPLDRVSLTDDCEALRDVARKSGLQCARALSVTRWYSRAALVNTAIAWYAQRGHDVCPLVDELHHDVRAANRVREYDALRWLGYLCTITGVPVDDVCVFLSPY